MWRRGIGLSECFFCIALAPIFLLWSLQARADAYSCERFLQQELSGLGAYLELVKTDKELVQAEQAYAATAGKFSALFADDTQEYLTWFFKEIKKFDSGIEEFNRKGFRDVYIKRRSIITEYLNEVLVRRDDPTLFPLLHSLSILFFADPMTFSNLNPVQFKADYTKFRTLPDGGKFLQLNDYSLSYEIYPFPDQTWAMIRQLLPRTGFALVRFKDGKISFSTTPTVQNEDFYTSGQAVFAIETPSAKEVAAGVKMCSMFPVLKIDTSHIPFVIKAELQQRFNTAEIPYTCIPECSIPFVWTGAGYRQGEKTCLPQGQWGVFSPFRGDDLARIDDAYRTFARLAAQKKKFTSVIKEFSSLFSDDNQRFLASLQQRQKLQQQIGLQILIDDQDTLVETAFKQDQIVIDYMELVIELAKTPDERLLRALDPLHDAINWISLQEAGFDNYTLEALYPYANAGASYWTQLAWVVDVLRGRKTTAGEKNADEEDDDCCDGSSYSTERSYILHKAVDGALWGESVIDFVEMVPGGNSRILSADRYTTLIRKGKIHLLTPGLPMPEDFFRDGTAGLAVMEPSTEEKKRGIETVCALRPALEMDTSRTPFRLKAFLLQTDADDALIGTALCTAQCVIPYHWDEAECLEPGKWGKVMKK